MSEIIHQIAIYFIIFMLASFVGWIIEMFSAELHDGHMYNRGFLIGPVCPIYGTGTVLISILLGGVEHPVAIFCVAMVGSGLLEYLTSVLMEKLFHARWWDYSDRAFNLNGRVCLAYLIMFGFIGVFVIKIADPWLFGLLNNIDRDILYIVAVVLFITFMTDLIFSLILILRFKVAAGTLAGDATEEISAHIREIFMERGKLGRRLMTAFPSMEVTKPKAKNPRPKAKTTKTAKTRQKRQNKV